jgi:hypothetical protein
VICGVVQFIIYQQQVMSTTRTHPDGRPVEDQPLILGLMTAWQKQQARMWGHGSAVLMDSTHGMNKYGVSVTILCVRVVCGCSVV